MTDRSQCSLARRQDVTQAATPAARPEIASRVPVEVSEQGRYRCCAAAPHQALEQGLRGTGAAPPGACAAPLLPSGGGARLLSWYTRASILYEGLLSVLVGSLITYRSTNNIATYAYLLKSLVLKDIFNNVYHASPTYWAALHKVGATIGRSLPATRTSYAGGTGLACLARPMWRSAVEDRLAFVLFRVRTAAERPRKASVPVAAAMGTAICSGRAPAQELSLQRCWMCRQ
jgi:hypothetical protein